MKYIVEVENKANIKQTSEEKLILMITIYTSIFPPHGISYRYYLICATVIII